MSTKKTALCIFVKAPIAGHVKTRLSPPLESEDAATVAGAFFRDTLELSLSCDWAKVVVACDGDPENLGIPEGLPTLPQGPGDLGERMERVLAHELVVEQASAAMAVGTDSPGLPKRLLDDAHRLLQMHDAVIGPSDDGGFYLVGLRRCPLGLFRGLPWSTETTREQTVARLRAHGLGVQEIDPWFDVDRPSDLERLAVLLHEGQIIAPHTSRQIDRLGLLRRIPTG